MPQRYIIIGGDMRYVSLADMFSETEQVYAYGFCDRSAFSENVIFWETMNFGENDIIILPIPVSTDNSTLNTPLYNEKIYLDKIVNAVKPHSIVFGGRISDSLKAALIDRGAEVYDYLNREELAVLNAMATAEGALETALANMPTIISGKNVLILGMGRIAKSLIRVLGGFGVQICAAARKCSDLAWAEVLGCRPVHIEKSDLYEACGDADIIFNTVPHLIMDKAHLQCCKKECLIIDLASGTGGTDFEGAAQLGIKAVHALSLPGKTAPVSSAMIIKQTITNILNERSCAKQI